MRFRFLLVVFRSVAIASVATACVDVTCAERGTCAPADTTEQRSDAAATDDDRSSAAVMTAGNPSNESTATRGTESNVTESDASSGCFTRCASLDASASGPSTSADLGSVTRDASMGPSWSARTSSEQWADASACVEICECSADGCAASSAPVEAGPPVCSAAQAADCVSPTSICVLEDDAPLCVECRNSDDCSAPTSVCIAAQCEVCDLDSNAGCEAATPFCVAVGAATGGGGTTEPGVDGAVPAASALPEPGDAGASAARICVECQNETHCGGATPLCSAGSCVQCLADTDCTDPDAPRCDTETNTCAGCNAVGQCSRFGETPACNTNDGKCVECTAAEPDVCEEFACQTTPGDGQYTCSEQELKSAKPCGVCVSDAACGEGMACVLEQFGGQNTEWVCLRERPEGGCVRPLMGLLEEATSADSQEVRPFCKPAATTCGGYRHYGGGGLRGEDPCQTDEDCGLPGLNDGLCVQYPNTSVKLCSYPCLVSFECASPRQCIEQDETSYCSLN